MGLLDDMNKLDMGMGNTVEKENKSPISSMFQKKEEHKVVQEVVRPPYTEEKPSTFSSRGAHGYSTGTDRKMIQVTTRLTEDNYSFLEEFARSKGLNKAGLISYALNYIIDEKRGLR